MKLRAKRILVACEVSGVVRDAFRALGHDAYSCDMKGADSEFHIQGDVTYAGIAAAMADTWGKQ
jgi:hypothetical protein